MSYTSAYIITTMSASSKQRCNSLGNSFQAPFSITSPGPISLRGKQVPYLSSRGATALDFYTRPDFVYPFAVMPVAEITGSWVEGKS